MQRTFKTHRFTYIKSELNPDGTICANLDTIDIPETDIDRAYTKATKKLGMFNPVKVETVEIRRDMTDEFYLANSVVVGEPTVTAVEFTPKRLRKA